MGALKAVAMVLLATFWMPVTAVIVYLAAVLVGVSLRWALEKIPWIWG